MDDDKTSLSGTQSNDTIIELTGAVLDAKSNNDPASGKSLDPGNVYCVPEDDKYSEATKQLSTESNDLEGDTKVLPNLENNDSCQEEDKKNNAEARTPPVVSSGLMILDLLKLKKRKIGHRRVNEEGEITFKKIQTSWIVGSIQLGIGHAIGSLASKPERDLLMQDFAIVETTAFPREGGPATPAHHFSDFKFRAYAPVAFRHFRDLFGIRPDDFLLSLCDKPMVQLANPGASGSIFYVTDDDNFIVKTVDHREADFLQKLLPGYYMNVNQNPRTLLPKFFGLYCYQCSNKNVRLVVMNNLLPSGIRLHERYDLKGSTYKRKASRAERKKRSPTYKDLDYLERHPDGIHLDPDTYSALVGTLRRDCRVLESFKIMDYSLLVGIHNVDAAQREKENESSPTRASGSGLTRSKSMNRQRLAAFSTAMESIRADVDVAEGDEDVPPGGIPARNAKGERLLLFLGIIDILQSFVLKKKLEHTFKAIVHDGDTVSVHRPGFYAQRFLDFMSDTVFKKASPLKHTPSRRNKGQLSRKVSAETEGVARRKTRSESENSQKEPELSFMERHSNPEGKLVESAGELSFKEALADLSFSEPVADFSFKESMTKLSFSESVAEHSLVSPPRTIPLCVTWAETEVLELSQVVIETDSSVERGEISYGKWTPPHSVGGSTPTHTEGTPSLTESSPSPTTPSRSLRKSVDSLPPLEETRVQ